ncbi:MAG TPA: ABC transporter ATP-binding protein, partial [Nitrospiria bacterium]|nr:ABC transporter ATP-binding protein [Nitrospiria bacterium]
MNTYKRLAQFLKPYLRQMAAGALLVAGVGGINLFILWTLRGFTNAFLQEPDPAALNRALVTILILFVVHGALTMGHSYLIAFIGQRVVADFRTRLFRHLGTLSVSFFAKRRTGELISRLTNDVGVIQNVATETPIDLAKHIVTLFGGMAILFYLNWKMCLMILAVLPMIVLVGKFFGMKLKRLSSDIQDRTAETTTVLEEMISGIRIIKSFVAEKHETSRYMTSLEEMVSTALHRARIMAVFVPLITIITFSGAALIMWYGGRQVMMDAITPGDLVTFILVGGIMLGPFGSFARLFTKLKEVQGATERVFEILDTRPEVADIPEAKEMPRIEGSVTFQNVHFAYDPAIPVLNDISLRVSPGEMVALVGPSGAGKSTLIHLIHRFYDPSGGTVEIDGVDIKTVRRGTLYAQIGLVPQET